MDSLHIISNVKVFATQSRRGMGGWVGGWGAQVCACIHESVCKCVLNYMHKTELVLRFVAGALNIAVKIHCVRVM